MASWAKPGVKCICVDPIGPLVKGFTYTVRSTEPNRGNKGPYKNTLSLLILETRNPLSVNGGFAVQRFRPFISQADDVEMFRRISEDSLGRLEAYEELLNERFSCDETHE